MKRRWVIVSVSFVIASIIAIWAIDSFYIPLKCIYSSEEVCLESTAQLNSVSILKRLCNRYSDRFCISLLSRMHEKSMDNLIPRISDEHCLEKSPEFCAFSSIAYSGSGDIPNAFLYAEKGCSFSEGVSCAILASIELDADRRDSALKSSLKSCLIGSAAACAIAGTILLEDGQESEGRQLIERCCELGGDECCE